MNILRANFEELYERHLCRHSQFGINVQHLAGMTCTYLALFGIAWWLVGAGLEFLAVAETSRPLLTWGALLTLLVPYLVVLAANVPLRVFTACVAYLALFFAAFAAVPTLPVWLYPLLIVVLYMVQNGAHLVFPVAYDMTEFDRKYPKGQTLFWLLTVYELPIQLNYLLFGESLPRHARSTTGKPSVKSGGMIAG